MKKILISAALLLAGLSTNANAEFVTGDYLSANDSNVTLDTTTGLEWLGLSLTKGESINGIKSLIENGDYEGFRLATEDEVVFMFDQFLDESKNNWLSNSQMDFMNTLGSFLYGSGYYSFGLTEGESGAAHLYGALAGSPAIYIGQGDYALDFKSGAYAIYLVSDSGESYSALNDANYNSLRTGNVSSVPAPFALSLFAMLAFLRKRTLKTEG